MPWSYCMNAQTDSGLPCPKKRFLMARAILCVHCEMHLLFFLFQILCKDTAMQLFTHWFISKQIWQNCHRWNYISSPLGTRPRVYTCHFTHKHTVTAVVCHHSISDYIEITTTGRHTILLPISYLFVYLHANLFIYVPVNLSFIRKVYVGNTAAIRREFWQLA